MLLNCGIGEDSWIARKSNQSTLKETNPEYSLEAEAPILWPPDARGRLIRKDPDAGKDRRQEEKGMTGDEIVGWHHQLNGHVFEQTLGDSEGQGKPDMGWQRGSNGTTTRMCGTKRLYV